MIVTRFAPSPTGLLHLGHAFAAWTAAQAGQRFLLRIEDIDQGRARPQFVEAILRDLAWLGLTWEEPVLRQSARMAAYRAALDRLGADNLVYPCFCTRKDISDEIARADEAQHFVVLPASQAGPDGPLYPGTCRHLSAAERQERIGRGDAYALRLDAARAAALTGPLSFVEQGHVHPADPLRFGDLVIARKDMSASYHLAAVVDDAYQGVSLVTRGKDLLAACHVQRLLQALLGLPEPAYAHHRLILDAQGRKFSKRDNAVTLQALREQGATPADIAARFTPR